MDQQSSLSYLVVYNITVQLYDRILNFFYIFKLFWYDVVKNKILKIKNIFKNNFYCNSKQTVFLSREDSSLGGSRNRQLPRNGMLFWSGHVASLISHLPSPF